jgi:hypothetical protein
MGKNFLGMRKGGYGDKCQTTLPNQSFSIYLSEREGINNEGLSMGIIVSHRSVQLIAQ